MKTIKKFIKIVLLGSVLLALSVVSRFFHKHDQSQKISGNSFGVEPAQADVPTGGGESIESAGSGGGDS